MIKSGKKLKVKRTSFNRASMDSNPSENPNENQTEQLAEGTPNNNPKNTEDQVDSLPEAEPEVLTSMDIEKSDKKVEDMRQKNGTPDVDHSKQRKCANCSIL